jgi:hypothetical protein
MINFRPKATSGKEAQQSCNSLPGAFTPVPDSDTLIFLRRALKAKKVPATKPHMSSLDFNAIALGNHQSRSAGDDFSENPPGDWVALKLFIGKGNNRPEVHLNLNPVLRKGEFSAKDESYSDAILDAPSKVL